MSSMSYSPFLSYEEQTASLPSRQAVECSAERQRRIEETVKRDGLILLENDYFGTHSYYYSPKTNEMMRVDNLVTEHLLKLHGKENCINPVFEPVFDPHIVQLNANLLLAHGAFN